MRNFLSGGKRKRQNLFKSFCIALPLATLSSCSDNNHEIAASPQSYRDIKTCWTNENGRFVAFLIASPQDGKTKLFYVSTKCSVNGLAVTNLGRYYQYIRLVMVADPKKLVRESLGLSGETLDILTTDSGFPRESDKVYYLVGNISRRDTTSNYELTELHKIKDLELSLSGLADLKPRERAELVTRFDPGA